MGVFQRYTEMDKNGNPKKTGPWFIQYPHSRDPQTGKIRYKTKKASWRKKVAVKMLREKQDAFLKKGTIGIQTNEDLTLSELLDWGLQQEVMKAKKSSGADNSRIKHLVTQLGDVRACSVTPLMVDNFKTLMKSTLSEKTKKPYSGSTINKMINIPRRIYKLAMDAGIVDRNPFAKRGAFKETPKGKYISEEDFWALYNHLPEYIKPIALIGFYTGMRRGEIVDLDWDRVDVSIGLIDLSEDFTKTEEPRQIYFNSIHILRDLFNELAQKRSSKSPYVFLWEGKPVNREGVSKWFKKASIMAKVGPYRLHDLRHTFNTNMRKAGVDQVTIMKLTGHKTLNMFTRYSHVDEKQANDAMTKLGSLLEGAKG